MEEQIYNWKYIFKEDGFDIIPNEPIEKPQILFKLYGLNKYSIDSLIYQYVYASHPDQFNDLFDCNENLLEFDDIDAIKWVLTEERYNSLIKKGIVNLNTCTQRNFKQKMYRKLGIFSMTGNPNNVLMWSYYCNNNGFCIEFDISQLPFKFFGPFPINYQPSLEALSIKKFGVQIGLLAQSNLKDEIWKHENEWRLLIEAPKGEEMFSPNFEFLKSLGGHNRKFFYPISAIKSIALGNRFFEPDEIKEINKMEMEINIKSNFEQKSIMLDFISENKIKTHIGMRRGFTEIAFQTIYIEKINIKKFKIVAY